MAQPLDDLVGEMVVQRLAGPALANVVTDPDLDDPTENQARWQLLTWHRDYGTCTGLFDGFPGDVSWAWMAITPAELARVRYVEAGLGSAAFAQKRHKVLGQPREQPHQSPRRRCVNRLARRAPRGPPRQYRAAPAACRPAA